MEEKIQNTDTHMIRPSYFGDISNSGYSGTGNSLRPLREEGRLHIPLRNVANNTDSLSDVEVIVSCPGEDADQQFWGDNELDSTSLSDTDVNNLRPMKSGQCNIPSNVVLHCSLYNEPEVKNVPSSSLRKRKRTKRKRSISASPSKRISLNCVKLLNIQATLGAQTTLRRNGSTSMNPAEISKQIYDSSQKISSNSSSTESDSTLHNDVSSNAVRLQNDENVPHQHHQTSPSSTDEDVEVVRRVSVLPGGRCPCCEQRPKDAIIVHGAIGHQCYCYQCAMKMWKSNANCPLCKRRIRKVIKS